MGECHTLLDREKSIAPDNLDDLAEVNRNINIPVVTGEALYTKSDFRQVFEKRAAEIINPDVCCTGLLELKEIAAMAEPYPKSRPVRALIKA